MRVSRTFVARSLAVTGTGVAGLVAVAGVVRAGGDGPPVTGLPAVLLFVAGSVLLVVSAEKFIGYLVKTAHGLDVSLFLLAVVFTGVEFDDAVLGVATNLEDLGGVALGTALGTALSLTGVTLAVTALVRPFEVAVPRDYLWILAVSPLALVPAAAVGSITGRHGAALLVLFLVVLAYFVSRESERETPVLRDDDVDPVLDGGQDRAIDLDVPFVPARELPGAAWLVLAVLALVGIVAGAESVAVGVEGVLADHDLRGTVFGATVLTAVLTVEDVFLTLEPVRRGVPEIGIGNVIGSVVFSVTGNVGVVALAGSVAVGRDVVVWHLPVLVGTTALAAYFVGTGRIRRWHGAVLLGVYAAYWIVSFALFGGAPVEA